MIIKGEVKRMARFPERAPNDGVHQANSDGLIKGAKAVLINGEVVPLGMTAFLYKGLKVFYGFKSKIAASEGTVREVMNAQKAMNKLELALPVHGMVDVRLKLTGDFGTIDRSCMAYKTDVVPMTWTLVDYFAGKAYQWSGCDDAHMFHYFVTKALVLIRKKMPKSKLLVNNHWHDLYKIGNTLWHRDHQRYYIVDCG